MLLSNCLRDESRVPQCVEGHVTTLPDDGVRVAASFTRGEVQGLVNVSDEVGEEAQRVEAAGFVSTRQWNEGDGTYSGWVMRRPV